MDNLKRIVIVGATSCIAHHCARLWATRERVIITLVGRNARRLQDVASDLHVRSPRSLFRIVETDCTSHDSIRRAVNSIVEDGPVDIVLIATGALIEQEQCQADLAVCRESLEVNAVFPVLFAEAFAQHMAKRNAGTLAIIGSVAGDRGRKSNYVYGAAKGLVTRYAQGLQHRFARSPVKIVLIKPGPTDTPMTAHLKTGGARLAPVQAVARQIVAAIDQGKPVVYAPSRWQLIMSVIRHLPPPLFNRLNI